LPALSFLGKKFNSFPYSHNVSKVASMSKSQNDRTVTKDKLIGMKVISSEGKLIGSVTDVGFTIGKSGVSLSVETVEGGTQDIAWEKIQGALDFVVLKPEQEATQYSSGPQNLQQAQNVQSMQHVQPVQHVQQAQPVQTAQPIQQSQPMCPNCKGPLTYIPQYKRWYCYKCQKYA
jgi:sporulation protein YlmC with PRC-barrel domain/ribosomal protein S27AE